MTGRTLASEYLSAIDGLAVLIAERS